MWGSFIKFISMIVYKKKTGKRLTKILKPGEREIDGRFKDGVDTGRFSSNKIPLPLKPKSPVSPKVAEMLNEVPSWVNLPKQAIRQLQANRHFKNNK